MSLRLALAGLVPWLFLGAALADTPRPSPQELAAALRAGGLVLYLRHPETNQTQADQPGLDLADCATQRSLSPAGRQQAAAIGAALRLIGVTIRQAVTSEYCRARETAVLMGIPTAATDAALNEGGRMQAGGPTSPMAEALRARLRQAPPPGGDMLVVSHRPNLVDAAGPEFADLAEAEMVVFRARPEVPGFEVLARIRPADWPALVAAGRP
jgi:phosphohistidine phosphatase SixA